MNYDRILSDHRFLHTSPGFSAHDVLDAIHSPRVKDMPQLGYWIDQAADEAGIARELLCTIPQKEQSGLTHPDLRPFALRAFCGYGVTRPGQEPREEWRGPEKQLRAAAKRLRELFDLATTGGNNWIAKVGQRFGPVGVIPMNAATAALYSYTPSKPDKANILRIWRAFNFGDPIADEEMTMPSRFMVPIDSFEFRRLNNTLHGRSVYRPENVPGHNVFKGWRTWINNGHVGVGDALDLFGHPGIPVMAICDGKIVRWDNDTEKLEVIYLEAPGVVAVYAHIDYLPRPERVPRRVKRGDIIGKLRGNLTDPHLHFELWLDGEAVAAPSPRELRDRMLAHIRSAPASDEPSPWAREAAEWAIANGITDGTRPHEPQTREESWVEAFRLRHLIRKADSSDAVTPLPVGEGPGVRDDSGEGQ